jgi:uncharacterized protein (DUF1697 family)
MPRYLALLRGINVGGHNKVAMADLRELAAGLGYTDIATYIQSGNLLFSSSAADPAGLAAQLEREIPARLGVRPAVVVVSAAQLAQVIADNPFPQATNNPKYLHAVFRNDDISKAGMASVAAALRRARAAGSADDAIVVGRTLFLYTPAGLGRSDLAVQLGRSAAQAGGTARNWATVTRLMTMLDAAR